MTVDTTPRSNGRCEASEGSEVRTGLISGVNFTNQSVRYTVVDRLAIFEGDIVLGTVEAMEAAVARGEADLPGSAGLVTPDEKLRWPGGSVPYVIDPGLPQPERARDAIAHWEQHTKIRFVRRTAANAASLPDFVAFEAAGGCSSPLGRRGGRQVISLGPNCKTGNAIHEIGHAVGLWHEQGRADRGQFVAIHLENVDPANRHNFDQHVVDGDDVGDYDYDSIMHYGSKAFSNNGQDTISPVNPADGARLGQRNGLSAGDIAAIRALYPSIHP
jgi:hypothetical protein